MELVQQVRDPVQVGSEEVVQQAVAVIKAIHLEKVRDVEVPAATVLKMAEEARG